MRDLNVGKIYKARAAEEASAAKPLLLHVISDAVRKLLGNLWMTRRPGGQRTAWIDEST